MSAPPAESVEPATETERPQLNKRYVRLNKRYIARCLVLSSPPPDSTRCPLCFLEWDLQSDTIVGITGFLDGCNLVYHGVCLLNMFNEESQPNHNKCPFCRSQLFPKTYIPRRMDVRTGLNLCPRCYVMTRTLAVRLVMEGYYGAHASLHFPSSDRFRKIYLNVLENARPHIAGSTHSLSTRFWHVHLLGEFIKAFGREMTLTQWVELVTNWGWAYPPYKTLSRVWTYTPNRSLNGGLTHPLYRALYWVWANPPYETSHWSWEPPPYDNGSCFYDDQENLILQSIIQRKRIQFGGHRLNGRPMPSNVIWTKRDPRGQVYESRVQKHGNHIAFAGAGMDCHTFVEVKSRGFGESEEESDISGSDASVETESNAGDEAPGASDEEEPNAENEDPDASNEGEPTAENKDDEDKDGKDDTTRDPISSLLHVPTTDMWEICIHESWPGSLTNVTINQNRDEIVITTRRGYSLCLALDYTGRIRDTGA